MLVSCIESPLTEIGKFWSTTCLLACPMLVCSISTRVFHTERSDKQIPKECWYPRIGNLKTANWKSDMKVSSKLSGPLNTSNLVAQIPMGMGNFQTTWFNPRILFRSWEMEILVTDRKMLDISLNHKEMVLTSWAQFTCGLHEACFLDRTSQYIWQHIVISTQCN